MLSEAHPYQLKVRDHFQKQQSIWEFFSDPQAGELEITGRIMTAVANHPDSKPISLRTANLFFRYGQIWQDRHGNPSASASDPSAVSASDPSASDDPIRAQALRLWLEQGENAEPAITLLVEGPLGLDTLDIFSQQALREQTRMLLQEYLRPEWFRTEPVLRLADGFFS